MGLEQVFDNLTFNHMDALRKQIQSLVVYVLHHFSWDICDVKQIFAMTARITVNFFESPTWLALISTRHKKMGKLILLRSPSIWSLKLFHNLRNMVIFP